MRKTTSKIITPGLQPPRLTTTLKRYHRSTNDVKETKPAQPSDEAVDRLNIIGKTYPFCVYYRPQVNDPL